MGVAVDVEGSGQAALDARYGTGVVRLSPSLEPARKRLNLGTVVAAAAATGCRRGSCPLVARRRTHAMTFSDLDRALASALLILSLFAFEL